MVDVIIPAYNAYNTLRNTLMSLAMQRLAKLLDVLVINDGSTNGGYRDIIDEFTTSFKSIKIIDLESNHGVGFCRQLALKMTKNKLIYFIDSDDCMLSSLAFNIMLSKAEELKNVMSKEYDFSMLWFGVNQEFDPSKVSFDTTIFNSPNGNMMFLHGKLFNRSVIDRYKLGFVNTRSNEDIAFNIVLYTLNLYKPADFIIEKFLDVSVVETLWNDFSITRGENSSRKFAVGNYREIYDSYVAMQYAFAKCTEIIKEPTPEVFKYFIHTWCNHYMRYVLAMSDNNLTEEEYKYLSHIIIAYYKNIIQPILKSTPDYKVNMYEESDFSGFWMINECKRTDVQFKDINEWIAEMLPTFDDYTFKAEIKKFS